jgi:hypothetical protein
MNYKIDLIANNKRRTPIRVKRARLRAIKYCFITLAIGVFFTVPLYAVVHGLV